MNLIRKIRILKKLHCVFKQHKKGLQMRIGINSGVVLMLLGCSPIIHAVKDPYIGVEIIQSNQNFKFAYGDGVFKKNPQNYSLFGGFLMYKFLGVEGGYDFQPNRDKNVFLGPGDYVPTSDGEGLIDDGSSYQGTSSYKSSDPYLSLFAQYKQNFKTVGIISLKLLIGASFSHVNAQTNLAASQGNITGSVSVRTYSISKVVPMAIIAITKEITPKLGVRISAQYKNMSKFKISSAQSALDGSYPMIKMKDFFGIGLGLAYYF